MAYTQWTQSANSRMLLADGESSAQFICFPLLQLRMSASQRLLSSEITNQFQLE